MEQTYSGEKGTVGYKSAWVSENQMVGTGSQEVIEIRENEFMKTKMLFNGEAAENFASFTLSESDGKQLLFGICLEQKPLFMQE